MKCPKCQNGIKIGFASKLQCKGCRVLTNLTTVATVQCEKCGKVFQVPLNSKYIMSIKKDEE